MAARGETSLAGEREYLFLNPTVWEVCYESVPREERREYHARVAAWLMARSDEEVREHLGLIADHLERAGQMEQAVVYLRRAGEQAAAQFANAEAVAYLSRALDLTPEDAQAERYALLLAREKVYDLQGDRDAQRQDLAILGTLGAALADALKQAEVAQRQARHATVTGDYPAAIAAARTAIDLARAAQSASSEAAGYLRLGRALWHQGEYEAAQSQLEQALNLARVAGVRQIEADSLHNLGIASYYQGDRPGATMYWEQGLSIYREIGHRHGEGLALSNLGEVSMGQGDHAAAKTYLEQALHIDRAIGNRTAEGYVLGYLGLVSLGLGDYAEARAYLEQSLSACRETAYRRGECQALSNLGLLSSCLGDDKAARECSQQALSIANDIGERNYQGYALTNLGHALAGLGDLAEAADVYRQALALRRELGQQSLAMESLAGLARVFLAQGDLPQAQAQAEEILRYLETKTLDGTDEPLRIYLTCYRILRATLDSRAQTVLDMAHRLLQERAAKITDGEMRCSFLENVAAHREIVHEFSKT